MCPFSVRKAAWKRWRGGVLWRWVAAPPEFGMDDGAQGRETDGSSAQCSRRCLGMVWWLLREEPLCTSMQPLSLGWNRCDELDSLLDRSCVWSGGKASSKQYMQQGWLIQTTRRHDDITASRVRAGGQLGGRCTGAGMRERPLP
jgi:hypothetical protein